jgi:hypothetical protein
LDFSARSSVTIRSGGRLVANDTIFDIDDVTLNAGAVVQLTLNRFIKKFEIASTVTGPVMCNDFGATSLQVVAVGNATGQIDLTKNWWGSIDPVAIETKILHRPDDPNRPLVRFQEFLELPARVPDLEAVLVDLQIGRLIAGNTVTFKYQIDNVSSQAAALDFQVVFEFNCAAFRTTLATITVPTIAPATQPGQPAVQMGIVMATFPTANLILLQGDPEFCTFTMRLDVSNAIKERDETNNIASKDIWIIPTPPNPLLGDYNYDGSVDAADYVVWRDARGKNFDHRPDSDGNAVIDQADYNFWRARFGATLQAAAASEFASAAFISEREPAHADNFTNATMSLTAIDYAFESLATQIVMRRPETRPRARLGFGLGDRIELLLSIVHTLPESRGGLGSGSNISMVAIAPSNTSDIDRELEPLGLSPAV